MEKLELTGPIKVDRLQRVFSRRVGLGKLEIVFESCRFEVKGIPVLLEKISSLELSKLWFIDCPLNPELLKRIFISLKKNTKLAELNSFAISNCHLLQGNARSLDEFCRIRYHVDTSAFFVLLSALGHIINNGKLSHLDLSKNKFDNTQAGDIFTTLSAQYEGISSSLRPLQTLDFTANMIGPLGCETIPRMILSTGLKNLILDNCLIKDEGAKILYEGLRYSSASINTLSLKGNQIRAEGFRWVSALIRNVRVSKLYLNFNFGCSEGALHLSRALKADCELEELYCLCCGLSDGGLDGLTALGESLSHNRSLVTLDITGNTICAMSGSRLSRYNIIEAFAASFINNRSLMKLVVEKCELDFKATRLLSTAFLENEFAIPHAGIIYSELSKKMIPKVKSRRGSARIEVLRLVNVIFEFLESERTLVL